MNSCGQGLYRQLNLLVTFKGGPAAECQAVGVRQKGLETTTSVLLLCFTDCIVSGKIRGPIHIISLNPRSTDVCHHATFYVGRDGGAN